MSEGRIVFWVLLKYSQRGMKAAYSVSRNGLAVKIAKRNRTNARRKCVKSVFGKPDFGGGSLPLSRGVALLERDEGAMGRLIGDGAICWYLEDIVALPEYQGKGIGKMLVNLLLEYVRQNSLPGTEVSVFLMFAKGKEGFYEKLDF